jgi:hypothetical protein
MSQQVSNPISDRLVDEFEETIHEKLNEAQGKSPAQSGVTYYIKHLGFAIAIGIAMLLVTYIALRITYGPLR